MNERLWTFENCAVRCICTNEKALVLYVFSPQTAQAAALRGWNAVSISVDDWNRDFSPWPAKAVFRGQPDFSGGAGETLRLLTEEILPAAETELTPSARFIAGYSLAGLFAVYAALETNLFHGLASVSGSMWYPGFADYVCRKQTAPKLACFSVGDRERFGRNPAFHTIEEDTKRAAAALSARGAVTDFSLNPGNHFENPEARMLRALDWLKNAYER